jgi:hypothetical protein
VLPSQGQDPRVAQSRPHDVADRDLETDRGSKVTHDEVCQPIEVSQDKELIVAVIDEPDLPLLVRGIGPKDLDRHPFNVDLEQQKQKDRDHDHGEDHGAQTSYDEDQHGLRLSIAPGHKRQRVTLPHHDGPRL